MSNAVTVPADKLAELQRDAARYRYLRDHCVGEDDMGWLELLFPMARQAHQHPPEGRAEWVDLDVDAAMSQRAHGVQPSAFADCRTCNRKEGEPCDNPPPDGCWVRDDAETAEWSHVCKGFGGKLLHIPHGEQCDRCGSSEHGAGVSASDGQPKRG